MNEPKPQPRDIMSETFYDQLERELAECQTSYFEVKQQLTQAQARCAETRRDALEEAAKVCEMESLQSVVVHADPQVTKEGLRCAAAIRALQDQR